MSDTKCPLQDFCDATFESNQRRSEAIDYLVRRIHNVEFHVGAQAGCQACSNALLSAGLVA